jgi:hypothetical protein
MRFKFFSLLGINSERIVSGYVLSNQVFIPRVLHCSFALSNPLEIRLLAKKLKDAAKSFNNDSDYHKSNNNNKKKNSLIDKTATTKTNSKNNNNIKNIKKNLILIQRYTDNSTLPWGPSKPWPEDTLYWKGVIYHSSQAFKWSRDWDNDTFNSIYKAFRNKFVEHNIVNISSFTYDNDNSGYNYNNNNKNINKKNNNKSSDITTDENSINNLKLKLSREIEAFSNADIVVGAHGFYYYYLCLFNINSSLCIVHLSI